MSYNPARHYKAVKNIKRVPRGGIKHSDIIKKYGLETVVHSEVKNKKSTKTGWESNEFKNKNFEVVFEYLGHGNGTGTIINKTQDRFMRVLSGVVFVTVKGVSSVLRAGQNYIFIRKEEYSINTGKSSDAELVFCQNPNYSSKIKVLAKPEFFTEPKLELTTKANSGTAVKPRRKKSKALQQAINIQKSKESRLEKVKVKVKEEDNRPMVPGQIIVGTSPMPTLPKVDM
jgi:mannose-6-phosphate isomerase-like protein (cupin superfamily)